VRLNRLPRSRCNVNNLRASAHNSGKNIYRVNYKLTLAAQVLDTSKLGVSK